MGHFEQITLTTTFIPLDIWHQLMDNTLIKPLFQYLHLQPTHQLTSDHTPEQTQINYQGHTDIRTSNQSPRVTISQYLT